MLWSSPSEGSPRIPWRNSVSVAEKLAASVTMDHQDANIFPATPSAVALGNVTSMYICKRMLIEGPRKRL